MGCECPIPEGKSVFLLQDVSHGTLDGGLVKLNVQEGIGLYHLFVHRGVDALPHTTVALSLIHEIKGHVKGDILGVADGVPLRHQDRDAIKGILAFEGVQGRPNIPVAFKCLQDIWEGEGWLWVRDAMVQRHIGFTSCLVLCAPSIFPLYKATLLCFLSAFPVP